MLPSYDLIKKGMEEQLFGFELDEVDQSNPQELASKRLELNIINAMQKLEKYRQLLTSPIYLVAVVLMPWYKWTYFEDSMSASDLAQARTKVQKLWQDLYANIEVAEDDTPSPGSQNNKVY